MYRTDTIPRTDINFTKPEIFDVLAKDELTTIDNYIREVQYNPGEKILKQGAPFTHIVYLGKGRAKIHLDGVNGRDLILQILQPLEFHVGPGCHIDDQYSYSLTAIEPSTVRFIDKAIFFDLMNKSHEFLEAFVIETQYNLAKAFKKLITLNQKNARGRVADAILYLADEIYKSDKFTPALSKIEFAELAGVSKETIYKILNEFENDKLIKLDNESYEILDKDLLFRIRELG